MAGGGWSLYRQYRRVAAVPVSAVGRGVFVDEVRVRGDVRPLKSQTVNAPMASSGDLRIVKLVKNGAAVRKGDFSARMRITRTGLAGKVADTLNEIIESGPVHWIVQKE